MRAAAAGVTPSAGSTGTRVTAPGRAAATSSISIPPSAEAQGGTPSLLRRVGDFGVRHQHAVLRQELAFLVHVQIHPRSSCVSGRLPCPADCVHPAGKGRRRKRIAARPLDITRTLRDNEFHTG